MQDNVPQPQQQPSYFGCRKSYEDCHELFESFESWQEHVGQKHQGEARDHDVYDKVCCLIDKRPNWWMKKVHPTTPTHAGAKQFGIDDSILLKKTANTLTW